MEFVSEYLFYFSANSMRVYVGTTIRLKKVTFFS
jgi:hypothetical protein